MNITEYNKLEKVINRHSFGDSYKTINYILIFLSILGNLTSVFLSNFLIVKIFSSIINQVLIVNILSISLLSGLELLKRDIFAKMSFQYLKSGGLKKDVIFLLATSIIIVSISFYASIRGAKEFSSKSKEIELSADIDVESYSDSISNVYNKKISEIELEIINQKSKIEEKDNEQTYLSSLERMNSQQRSRVKDLKQEKIDLRSSIEDAEIRLKEAKEEKNSEIDRYKSKISEKSEQDKSENSSNSIFFVVVSTIIELTILIGVYFNNYYKFRSYVDYKSSLESNKGYQKWILYEKILSLMYGKDKSTGDKISSGKVILEVCKANEMKVSQKDISDFLKIISSLGIIKTSGSTRTIQKDKLSAEIEIRNHFGIE